MFQRKIESPMSPADNEVEKGDSILKVYMKQLMQSGRTDDEIVTDIETYYNQLCSNCDSEILRLREELEMVEAEKRTGLAEEVISPMADLDNLSNFFLDCIYAQRKSLRQKLVRLKDEALQKPPE